ncbi:MAG: hypothetical protein PHT79_08300 [Syntrophomonadaceae bacterium]|nr:hypothetical protein [Syntrophomonadaceae bacterium]MDD4549740.1 hypothetical protein [Syntrophomonadaceae bacterium]
MIRNEIIGLLSTRRQYRKTRYHKPFFDTRKKPADGLAPSIEKQD